MMAFPHPPKLPPVSSPDEAMWRAGFMPEWMKRELGPFKFTLPTWLRSQGSAPLPPTAVEVWRVFRDGFYEVSSFGNVRRAKPGIATFVGRPLRPTMSATGYAQVQLGDSRLYVHRVVAEAFTGPIPTGMVINHKDLDKLNNRLSNLECISPAANSQHALANRKRVKGPTKPKAPLKGPQVGDKHWSRRTPEKMARGERQGGSKLTAEKVTAMRARAAAGEVQSDLAREYGISVAQMSRIVRGLRWAHVKAGGE